MGRIELLLVVSWDLLGLAVLLFLLTMCWFVRTIIFFCVWDLQFFASLDFTCELCLVNLRAVYVHTLFCLSFNFLYGPLYISVILMLLFLKPAAWRTWKALFLLRKVNLTVNGAILDGHLSKWGDERQPCWCLHFMWPCGTSIRALVIDKDSRVQKTLAQKWYFLLDNIQCTVCWRFYLFILFYFFNRRGMVRLAPAGMCWHIFLTNFGVIALLVRFIHLDKCKCSHSNPGGHQASGPRPTFSGCFGSLPNQL